MHLLVLKLQDKFLIVHYSKEVTPKVILGFYSNVNPRGLEPVPLLTELKDTDHYSPKNIFGSD